VSNRRKIDLAKLTRVLARDMASLATTTPNTAVSPQVAAELESRGWERDREFTVSETEGQA
jgi:hypothetical protein